MRFGRKIIVFVICLVITVLVNSISNASGLKLEHLWSSQNAKEWVIGLKATNVREEKDKIIANVVLWNSTQTWIFVEQDFTRNKVGQFPVHTQGAYLLGPGYTKNLGSVEFSKGSFLQFNAKTAAGVGHRLGSPESNILLGAVAIDFAMRGFFSKELPPNAFDRPLVVPIEVGMASIDPLFYTITSHCSGTLGLLSKAIVMKDADKAIEALGKFLICTMESAVREKIKEWLIKLFSKEVAETWARKFAGSFGDFLNLPMRATLMGILTKYTLGAPSESWARIEVVEVKDVAQSQITSSLKISPSAPYYIGQTITATFEIKNIGEIPITIDVLTVGGRVNDICPNEKCPDFEWKENITLKPGDTYPYQGKLKLEHTGDYHFFTAYRTKDGQWNTNIPTAPEVINTVDILVKQSEAQLPVLKFPLSGNPIEKIKERKNKGYWGFGADWTHRKCGGLWKKHVGTDWPAKSGEDVYVAESGEIEDIGLAQSGKNWGKRIVIRNRNFSTVFTMIYEHVTPDTKLENEYTVGKKTGKKVYVTKGQKIATISDISPEPDHLHFAIRIDEYDEVLSMRGALPQKLGYEHSTCNDPLFPEKFIDPEKLNYEIAQIPEERISSIATALVIDQSGSMGSEKKLEKAQEAARCYIDSLPEGGWASIAAFSDSGRPVVELLPIETGKERLKQGVFSLSASANTNIGAGLEVSLNQLFSTKQEPKEPIILLLSDGKHNTGQLWPSVEKCRQKKVKVFTVAFGSNADQATLCKIAQQTGGRCSPAGLRNLSHVYHKVNIYAHNGSTLFSSSDWLRPGKELSYRINVPSDFKNLTFFTNWQGSSVQASIVKPDGFIIHPSSQIGSYHKGNTYSIFKIPAEPGIWEMRLRGFGFPLGGEQVNVAISGESEVYSNFLTFQPEYQKGQKVLIRAEVADVSMNKKMPLEYVKVKAKIEGPTPQLLKKVGEGKFEIDPFKFLSRLFLKQQEIDLYDDGAHDDYDARDGIFAGTFLGSDIPGPYLVTLRIEGHSRGKDISRQIQESFQIGPIQHNKLTISDFIKIKYK